MAQNIQSMMSGSKKSSKRHDRSMSLSDEDSPWIVSRGPETPVVSKQKKIGFKKKNSSRNTPVRKMSICGKSKSQSIEESEEYDLNEKSDCSHIDDQIFPEKARNGQEALDKFKDRFNFKCPDPQCSKKYFKLAIMDLMMPVMDGFDATEKILAYQAEHAEERDLGKYELCDVVALTSNTDKVTMDRCEKLGFKEVLNKPLDFDSLKRIACLYHYKMSHEEYLEYLKQEEELKALSNIIP